MAAAGIVQLIMSLLGSMGGQGGGASTGGIAGILGRDTSDRGSAMNLMDPGGGLVGPQAKKARGLSTGRAIGANILDPTGFMGLGKGKKKEEPSMEELLDRMKAWERAQPEYQAYKGQLDLMTPETGYGAISPDWGDILDRTLRKTSEVYEGSITSPGLYSQIKGDVARRGFADSPAAAEMQFRAGAQKAQTVGDVSADIAEQERAFTEGARKDYLNRLQSFAGYGVTPPDLNQLFALDALQTPQQQSGGGYAQLGSSLADMISGIKPKQKTAPISASAPLSYTGAGSIGYGGTYGTAPKQEYPVNLSGWGV